RFLTGGDDGWAHPRPPGRAGSGASDARAAAPRPGARQSPHARHAGTVARGGARAPPNYLVTPVGNVGSATGASQARLRSRVHTGRMRILVVDDDRSVRESLRRSLAFNGYEVELAGDGQAALDAVLERRPDAMVLDVMMPRVDGLEVCRRMRAAGDELPILVLTARDAVSDRVAGLDAGADDYLPKPFALEELLARLRALLRRRTTDDGSGAGGQSRPLQFADLTLDPETREVRRGDRRISLTRTEFTLLELLLANPRRVLSR